MNAIEHGYFGNSGNITKVELLLIIMISKINFNSVFIPSLIGDYPNQWKNYIYKTNFTAQALRLKG
jgi:hypothetical protein